jgi:2-polyprenyl-3-methyl-5-hydroxy-6-metoxy-1,4-benzoquinol methylase
MSTTNCSSKFLETNSELHLVDDIWYSNENNSKISYPDFGNKYCFDLEEKSYWFIHRNEILKNVISKYANGLTFFDIGGGNGYVSKELIKLGFDTYLIEPGLDGISNAKERGVKNLINASLEEANFSPGSMDNIGLFDVVEHLKNDFQFLGLINNVIKNEGTLFLTVPSYSFLWSNDDLLSGHYRRYTINSITKILRSSGFFVIYKSYFFSFLVPLIYIFKTLPSYFQKYKPKLLDAEDHIVKSTFALKFYDLVTRYEYKRIDRDRKILFGSSCLIVAKKTRN